MGVHHAGFGRPVSRAAAILHTTKAAFVADATRQAAHRVLDRADVTLMAPEGVST